ncbi:hypothetical protein RW64_07880 [Geobacter sulfurreducens]|nr:hypothetical protein RW64_07880 [Geobacter sulfurreducens]
MKKKVLAVSAACALSAATAVPALALENEFHGMFRVFGYLSNYGNGGSGSFAASTAPAVDLADNARTRSYVEQRARLMYIAKANDDLKLVTHFEIDSRWGDSAYGNGRGAGAAVGADQVNLETKNVYLDFNIPSTAINAKVGVQPWTDSYGGIFVNADMAGALVSAKYAGFTNSIGWFRFNDDLAPLTTLTDKSTPPDGDFDDPNEITTNATTVPGKSTRDLFVLDSKYNLSKDVKLGASYYLLFTDQPAYGTPTTYNGVKYNTSIAGNPNTYTHMIGLNGEFKLDPVTLGLFGMYQFGDTPGALNSDLSAFAAGATAKGKLGIGTAKAAFLYTSGDKTTGNGTDNSAFQAISPESTFYAADMMILLRNKYNMNSDRAVVHSLNGAQANEGFIGGFVGYDANFTPKAFGSVNAGFAAAANTNNDSYLGTEVNAEVGYKLFDNMTASVQGAYFFLGDYFDKGATQNADDPYVTRVMLNYAF